MVAVFHSGLVCARCECEVLPERPAGVPHVPGRRGRTQPAGPGISAGLPAETPVFRFDSAHPTTGPGGKTSEPARKEVETFHAAAKVPAGKGIVPARQSEDSGSAAGDPAIRQQVTLTRALLVFFSGQMITAIAWFSASFPAFAVGVVLTLAGTGWLLQRAQGQGASGVERSRELATPPLRPRRHSPARAVRGQQGW